MTGFLIRRFLQMLLVLFLVTLFTLLLVRLLPGGPVRALVGPRATPEQIAYYNRLYGFDQPDLRAVRASGSGSSCRATSATR